MENTNTLKSLNWTVFVILLAISIITGLSAMNGLEQAEQSRVAFHWGSFQTLILCLIVVLTSLLTYFWNRIFPFNVPIALILLGGLYLLFFLTFTIGWVGLLGFMGLLVSLVVGVGLILFHSIYLYIKNRNP
ncbi:RND transporter [Pseudalkalibacillus decolorationis]|uniref:RND transporter n=1 Tax=Pseudalkalibacillus decolorationis TaxID=163879 RepID=UPI00214818EA|nr:RND transporter [Pseudalkalibacillus decolorationis]